MKTDQIILRADPKLKEAAKQRAQEEHRSLANYIEALILADIKKEQAA